MLGTFFFYSMESLSTYTYVLLSSTRDTFFTLSASDCSLAAHTNAHSYVNDWMMHLSKRKKFLERGFCNHLFCNPLQKNKLIVAIILCE